MPYAQKHYPFENVERFEMGFPAQFIAEGLDQTRGWFYTLSVLSTALFDKPAFQNVIVNGMVLAEDGRKMSKRLRNYTPPDELLEKFGADSVRLFMLNSPVLKAGDLCFSDQGVRDTTRAVLLPLWNAYSFLSTYADADGWTPSTELATGLLPKLESDLDRWILSRFQTLCEKVHFEMERYKLYAVVPKVLDFIEDLTNWYIRLSRKRFWGTDVGGDGIAKDTIEAYQTLYAVMLGFTRVFAPFAPFVADKMYRLMTEGLEGQPQSVHLTDMPMADSSWIDRDLEAKMELVRNATNLGRSLRAKHNVKTRQVLASMMVITRHESDKAAIFEHEDIIRSELNVKSITFTTDEARYVRLSLKPNLRTLGKRLGKELGKFRQFLSELNESHDKVAATLAQLESGGQATLMGHSFSESDFLIERGPKDERLIATGNGVTVLLDTRLTDELIAEGLAREIVNRIQKLRKESGLRVTDRIDLAIGAAGKLGQAVESHREYIARETLAKVLKTEAPDPSTGFRGTYDIDGMSCDIGIVVASA